MTNFVLKLGNSLKAVVQHSFAKGHNEKFDCHAWPLPEGFWKSISFFLKIMDRKSYISTQMGRTLVSKQDVHNYVCTSILESRVLFLQFGNNR